MLPPKDTGWLNGYKNKTHTYAVYKRPTSDLGTHTDRSEEHTSELQSHHDLVCRLLLEKKKDLQKQTQNNYKNGHRNIHIDNYLKCECIKCSNQKTQAC